MTRDKARVYKMTRAFRREKWVGILRSGTFGVFMSFHEALDFVLCND